MKPVHDRSNAALAAGRDQPCRDLLARLAKFGSLASRIRIRPSNDTTARFAGKTGGVRLEIRIGHRRDASRALGIDKSRVVVFDLVAIGFSEFG